MRSSNTLRPPASGATTREETPVPIPNTAVKLSWADDTPSGESRSVPVYEKTIRKDGFFFFSAKIFAIKGTLYHLLCSRR